MENTANWLSYSYAMKQCKKGYDYIQACAFKGVIKHLYRVSECAFKLILQQKSTPLKNYQVQSIVTDTIITEQVSQIACFPRSH